MTEPLQPPIALKDWRKNWYGTSIWQRRRTLQLQQHPLCAMCLAQGVTTLATVADHVESHGSDWNKFRLGKLQSVCKPCHDRHKRVLDERGYTCDVDNDGWPTDPRHPANRTA